MEELIQQIPLDAIAAAALLLAVLVAGLTEVARKLGAHDAAAICICLVLGQALSLGYWCSLRVYSWPGFYLAVVVGFAASLMAMGLWKTIQPRQK